MSDYPVSPLISIVIPTYNQCNFLAKAIRSAQRQTYSNIEIIVVDDHSTDSTYQVVQEIALTDPRVRYFKTSTQSNLPAVPRNIGIQQAVGEYVAFLDHDDLWRKKKLASQLSVMENNKDLSMVFSPLWQFSRHNFLWGLVLLRPPIDDFSESSLYTWNPIQCSSVLIRRSILTNLGGFNEDIELRAVEDYDLWLRVSRIGTIHQSYRIVGYYRHIRTSTSQRENMNQRLINLKVLHPNLILGEKTTLTSRTIHRLRITPKIIAKIRF